MQPLGIKVIVLEDYVLKLLKPLWWVTENCVHNVIVKQFAVASLALWKM